MAEAGAQERGELSFPVGLHMGLPQGPFAGNVNLAGGFNVGVVFPMASELGFRAELGSMIYGRKTRRVSLGTGALGLINFDVTTTNAIWFGNIGMQVGLPGPRLKPYLGGMIGFSDFSTNTSVTESNSADEPLALLQHSVDVALSQTVLGGLYIPLRSEIWLVDLGVRYTWNGKEVEYLTQGDITEDAGGNIVLTPRRTRADLLTAVIGMTLRRPKK